MFRVIPSVKTFRPTDDLAEKRVVLIDGRTGIRHTRNSAMRRTQRRRAAIQLPTEALESRLLLSATLDAGTLTIEGTEDNDRIRVVNVDDNLVVVVNGERTEFSSADVTSIEISAGEGKDRISLARVEQSALVDGGDGNDRIIGGNGDDTLNGGAGRDRIHGRGGSDLIDGGDGADMIVGNAGDDVLTGGNGRDMLNGGSGDDNIDGGIGSDRLRGGAGDDMLSGGDGRDRIDGQDGDDVLDGGAGNDRLNGQAGADVVNGGDGDDTLVGTSNEDALDGGAGENVIRDPMDGMGQRPTAEEIQEFIATRVSELFNRLDGNEDGEITADEVSENLWTRLAEADEDASGTVTSDELLAHAQSRLESGEGRGLRGPQMRRGRGRGPGFGR
ncbi:MAG: calcium-binding protein [Planctomycetota bacterium]